MPNYIENILISETSLSDIIKDNNVDFNLIEPMPSHIENTTCGTKTEYIDSSIKNLKERNETRRPFTKEEIALGASEGWYNWSKRNWGTKWNAMETNLLNDEMVYFETAWTPPFEFLKKLSIKNPDNKYTLIWRDEMGVELNKVEAINGEILE